MKLPPIPVGGSWKPFYISFLVIISSLISHSVKNSKTWFRQEYGEVLSVYLLISQGQWISVRGNSGRIKWGTVSMCCLISRWTSAGMIQVGVQFSSVSICSKISNSAGWPWWFIWMRRPTGDQEVTGSTPAEVGNILSWRLITKYFLQSFSTFRWSKKGSCQFLVKECAQYWLTA